MFATTPKPKPGDCVLCCTPRTRMAYEISGAVRNQRKELNFVIATAGICGRSTSNGRSESRLIGVRSSVADHGVRSWLSLLRSTCHRSQNPGSPGGGGGLRVPSRKSATALYHERRTCTAPLSSSHSHIPIVSRHEAIILKILPIILFPNSQNVYPLFSGFSPIIPGKKLSFNIIIISKYCT